MIVKQIACRLFIAFLLVAGALAVPGALAAQTTAPQRMVYNGHLLDASGNALTTAHSVRFSYWKSADYITGDITATGSIDVGASNYADWQEVHTVTPDSSGYFTVELGSVTALPDFSTMDVATMLSLYLQVEVKVSTAADTTYEVLDVNGSDGAVDRSPHRSVPFSLNTDLLDGHDIGTASGSIPLLGSGGVFSTGLMPSGVNADVFTLDADDSAAAAVTLTFGTTLAKTLTYNVSQGRFIFNAGLEVQGNIVASGGVQLGSYAPSTGTGAGMLRWTGTDFQGYDGTGWKSLSKAGKFAGTTTSGTTGSVSTGSLVGYKAGNEICAHEFTGSHMCQVDEIIATVEQDMTAFSGEENGWASMGAPGYTADANDCAGWTSADESYLGSWWEFSSDGGVTVAPGGGKGFLTNCAVSQPIACCR
ncbi:hypothetical protein A3J91_02410 [Candidatus Peribacteria bacterium RIFOXYC2_FULL_58_10]|nr:MAG: hypothetical protein A3J91_02410 [Candidatus Peribacteria bacterium RIFOXYC2_FULL_58_10]